YRETPSREPRTGAAPVARGSGRPTHDTREASAEPRAVEGSRRLHIPVWPKKFRAADPSLPRTAPLFPEDRNRGRQTMAAWVSGRIANRGVRFRHLAAATASLAALAIADPAWAQCATTTGGDGTVTIACANTITTPANNTNGNNPSTAASGQLF